MENGRCRIHGGKALAGIASPSFRTGKHSRFLPERMIEGYREALADPDLLNLQAEIALTDTRLTDLLSRVDTGEAGELWRSLRETYAAAEKAREKRNAGGVDAAKAELDFWQAFDTIGALIAEGVADYQAWGEVFACVERRRKLAETETARLTKLQQFITAERANTLVAAILASVRAHVSDRAVLNAIANDVRSVAAGGLCERAN